MFRFHLYCREVYGSCVDVRGVGGGCGGGSGGDAVGDDAAQFAGRHRRRLVGNVVGDAGNADWHPRFSAAAGVAV
jgi:hypothetical protein